MVFYIGHYLRGVDMSTELKTPEKRGKDGASGNTLRTLKDLYQAGCGGNYCQLSYSDEELRQEAINWIKEFNKKDDFMNKIRNAWIKHFFNITEKELK